MNEEHYKVWDLRIKIIAPLLTVTGLLLGVWQFTSGQAANDRLEFKRRTWEKQLDVYTKVCHVVGRIAAENQQKNSLKKNIDQFYSLYWGEMIYVEDKDVEKAMIDFHLAIHDYLNGVISDDTLKIRAKQLIDICRRSSRNQWFTQQQ